MLFHTPIFFAFFAVFFALYIALNKRLRWQNTAILLGSYVFYGAWDYRFLILIIISTVTDYLSAIGASKQVVDKKEQRKALLYLIATSTLILGYDLPANLNFLLMVYVYAIALWMFSVLMSRLQDSSKQCETKKQWDTSKIWLALSVVVNLGLLGVFKYFNFFADSLADLASVAGIELGYTTLAIVLPVGISFYTFQTMSYTIDVYRKKLEPSKRLIEVSAYIAFFPQLVAGPIERGSQLLPQFFVKRELSVAIIRSGVYLFLWGMFKKAVIADNLALIADPIFTHPGDYSSGALLVGLLAFTFQIYCDFSGYSDMARGIARMMGFNLMVNFNVPYISRTPSEFWRRWHISLSSWLRDYLYIPLGGNRGGEFKTYRNLFLTMLLGGLWHGASWTFVLWGVAHGTILILYRLLKIDDYVQRLDDSPVLTRYLTSVALAMFMFAFVVFTWLLFRAQTFEVVGAFTSGIFSLDGMASGKWASLLWFILPLWVHDLWQSYKNNGEFIQDLHWFLRLNVVLFLLCSFIFLQPGVDVAFLYFDF